jgi:N-acetylglucosamine kinase-like BadF-type ATPase
MAAVMKVHDARRDSLLTDMILKELTLAEPPDLIQYVYGREGKAHIAAVAPVVEKAWLLGDPDASRIFEGTAQTLAGLVVTVRDRKWPPEAEIVWSHGGGLLSKTSGLLERITEILRDTSHGLRYIPPEGDALEGGVRLLQRRIRAGEAMTF